MPTPPENRKLGPQPLAALLTAKGLTHTDLVEASPTPITHKLIARAEKGRWLTPHSRNLVLTAYTIAAKSPASLADLFNY